MAAIYPRAYGYPGCLGCMGIAHCGGVFDPSRIMVQIHVYMYSTCMHAHAYTTKLPRGSEDVHYMYDYAHVHTCM